MQGCDIINLIKTQFQKDGNNLEIIQNKSIKTQYGVNNGRIVSIWDVDGCNRGLKCDCKCPHCGMDLQARLGTGKRQPHFSHNNANCDPNTAQQTALHILAKEIIEEQKQVIFPPYSIDFRETDVYKSLSSYEREFFCRDIPPLIYQKEKIVHFDSVTLEKKLSSIVPDIIAVDNEQQYLIEIAVTHFVDEEKKARIIELDLPMIEIDLSDLAMFKIDKAKLKETIIENIQNKKWISNPKIFKDAKAQTEKYYEQEIKRIRDEKAKPRVTLEALRREKEKKANREQRKAVTSRRIKEALQPENYKKALLKLRDDEAFAEIYKRTLMYKEQEQYPFYLDLPIKGEFIFKCDRRIWQTFLFEKFIYNRNADNYGIINVDSNKIESWISCYQNYFEINWNYSYKCNVDGAPYHLISDMIVEYMHFMHDLGFIKIVPFDRNSPQRYATVLSPHNITPPNNAFSLLLENALKETDIFSVDAQEEICRKLNL